MVHLGSKLFILVGIREFRSLAFHGKSRVEVRVSTPGDKIVAGRLVAGKLRNGKVQNYLLDKGKRSKHLTWGHKIQIKD